MCLCGIHQCLGSERLAVSVDHCVVWEILSMHALLLCLCVLGCFFSLFAFVTVTIALKLNSQRGFVSRSTISLWKDQLLKVHVYMYRRIGIMGTSAYFQN